MSKLLSEPTKGYPLLFSDSNVEVYIDEKLLIMTRFENRCYLLPGEKPPCRTCKRKPDIPEVMLMAAEACFRCKLYSKAMLDEKSGYGDLPKMC